MKNQIRILSMLAVVAAAMTFAPVRVSAADTNAPSVEKPKVAKPKSLPFHGKLTAIDKTQMTLSVGERTFQITSDTKISKDGKPAIFSDAVVGDNVGGAYRKSDDGKLVATTINLGVKPTPEKPAKTAKPETNSPAAKPPGDM